MRAYVCVSVCACERVCVISQELRKISGRDGSTMHLNRRGRFGRKSVHAKDTTMEHTSEFLVYRGTQDFSNR